MNVEGYFLIWEPILLGRDDPLYTNDTTLYMVYESAVGGCRSLQNWLKGYKMSNNLMKVMHFKALIGKNILKK